MSAGTLEESRAAELERELASARAELAKSRASHDELAHAISHDLRAPLRAISTFSSWLERDMDALLTPSTREYMRLLRSRTQHLERLIEGMLQYSRAGSSEEQVERVDTGELVREIWEALGLPGSAALETDGLPLINTKRSRLALVLSHLMQNAARVSGADARIRVSARPVDSGYEFAVADNGPGIPERLQERLWLLFQSEQPPGTDGSTGVGLAVVKKIVEREGGRAWVESEPGAGATFRFLWPMGTT